MKNKLLNNEKLIIVAALLLMVGLFAGLYFFLLYPKMNEIPLKESELSTQEQILTTLQGKLTNTNSNTFESTVALQKLVPVKPLSQQLLLEIEKAEVVSGSFVVNMAFEDVEIKEENTEQTNESTENSEQTEETNQTEETGENSQSAKEEVEDVKEPLPLPTGVKKIAVTLEVESPTYFEFEKFLSILESSERITVVEAIEFSDLEEIIDEEQVAKPINYQVILSVFYMPTLTDLIESLPKMETPEPAKKKDPFSKFGEYKKTMPKKQDESVDIKGNNGNNTESDDANSNDSGATNGDASPNENSGDSL